MREFSSHLQEDNMRAGAVAAMSALLWVNPGWAGPKTNAVRSALARPSTAQRAEALRKLSDAEIEAMARTSSNIQVVGGETVAVLQFPWQVSLSIRNGSHYFKCGGTLIDARHVLTAAHCVDTIDARDLTNTVPAQAADVRAGFGSDRYLVGDTAVPVASVSIHPKWKQTGTVYDNDAAILELAANAPASARAIPLRGSAIGPGDGYLWVSGWGLTQTAADKDFYGPLQATRVTPVTKCGYTLTASMVCASAPGRDACSGDSGGPLVAGSRGAEQLVGIVSWGPIPCAIQTASGVYTRTSVIADWVRTATGNVNIVTIAALGPLFTLSTGANEGIVQ